MSILGKKIKEYSLPILLVSGLFLMGIYYFYKYFSSVTFQQHYNGFRELFGIALTILGSGIFLAVLKWFQFMGFFEKELQKIISSSEFDAKLNETFFEVLHSDEFLKKQKDLQLLWSRVNKALFNHRLPDELSVQAERQMQNLFFHNSKLSHYYKNMIYTINVSIDQSFFITIKLDLEAKIVRSDISPFIYDLEYYVEKYGANDNTSAVNIDKVIIDKQNSDLSAIQTITDNQNEIRKKFATELEGKKEYQINVAITLIYNINQDYEFQLYFERFVDFLRVEVNYQSLRVIFIPLGNEVFEVVRTSGTGFVRTYRNLLLPEKGFRLIFVQ